MTSKKTSRLNSNNRRSTASKTNAPEEKTPANGDPAPPARKKSPRRRRRQISRTFSAEEKAQAVLAAWTEKMSQSEICRQLQINYVTFQNWQKRAMEGMLQALEDHARLSDGAALSPRLRTLIERRKTSPKPLEERLRQVEESRDKTP